MNWRFWGCRNWSERGNRGGSSAASPSAIPARPARVSHYIPLFAILLANVLILERRYQQPGDCCNAGRILDSLNVVADSSPQHLEFGD